MKRRMGIHRPETPYARRLRRRAEAVLGHPMRGFFVAMPSWYGVDIIRPPGVPDAVWALTMAGLRRMTSAGYAPAHPAHPAHPVPPAEALDPRVKELMAFAAEALGQPLSPSQVAALQGLAVGSGTRRSIVVPPRFIWEPRGWRI